MSKIRNTLFLFLFLLPTYIYSQIETVDSQSEIYDFLKILSIKGVITSNDDIVLPLSKNKIVAFLKQASKNENLTYSEKDIIQRELIKYEFPAEIKGSKFLYNGQRDSEDLFYLFIHSDSVLNFQLNPVFEEKLLYSTKKNSASNLFSFGGKLNGTYLKKFAFEIKARNGIQSGEKSVSLIDRNVMQSFTFNRVGINFFDYTEGYLRYEDKKINLEIGRKRILWGNGIDKINISDNAPVFDFIKLGADFNFFKFDFLHGWLVQPPDYSYDSTAATYHKIKNPKYIALGRFGFYPSEYFSFGITQTIIYANRPFEAAYLNPFLFFESAQRSMNDLDNSFLGFDFKLNPIKGLQVISEISFDDFNFENIDQNRYILSLSTFVTDPLLPKNLLFSVGILKIDPYIYSHNGTGESLAYTNNSYLIGPNLQPNSFKFYFYLKFFVNNRIFLGLRYDRLLHGANVYDENGTLLENKGGNVFEPLRIGDSLKSNLLSGIRETEDNFLLSLYYSLLQGLYFSFNYEFNYSGSANHNIWSGIKFDL